MRRYELMLVLRPDIAEDRVQAALDRTTRAISAADGQLVKVSPWGRRRLAYPINGQREGSYYIILFDGPSSTVAEVERGLRITEEVLRYLTTRVERPAARRADTAEVEVEAEVLTPAEEEEEAPDGEFIDESESEAAPAAIE
jgi:small subunit ribosomal protein S6